MGEEQCTPSEIGIVEVDSRFAPICYISGRIARYSLQTYASNVDGAQRIIEMYQELRLHVGYEGKGCVIITVGASKAYKPNLEVLLGEISRNRTINPAKIKKSLSVSK